MKYTASNYAVDWILIHDLPYRRPVIKLLHHEGTSPSQLIVFETEIQLLLDYYLLLVHILYIYDKYM